MKLKLSLQAENLKNVAGMFKGISDPYAEVSMISSQGNTEPQVIGRTEVVKNNLNPDWSTPINFDYEPGYSVNLIVTVFDEVSKGKDIKMGSTMFEVGALVGANGVSMKANLNKGKNGILKACIEKVEGSGCLRLKVNCSNLKLKKKKKVDPFFQIAKMHGNTWDVVYKSAHVKKNNDPWWNEEVLQLCNLCGTHLDAPLQISVLDFEKDGKHELVASFQTSVNGFIKAKGQGGYNLVSGEGKLVGLFNVQEADIMR